MENPSPLHLLIAEDDEFVREALESTFRILAITGKFQAETIFATNGSEALEIIRSNSRGEIDALLTDFEMPLMNGAKLIAALREMNWKGKIAMMSGNPGKAKQALLDLGITDLEPHDKPISAEKLAEIFSANAA